MMLREMRESSSCAWEYLDESERGRRGPERERAREVF